MPSVTLVLDVGSSSVRCTPFVDGTARGTCAARAPLTLAPDGTMDASDVCARASEALRDAAARVCAHYVGGAGMSVTAVCFATLVGNIVGLDSTGAVITPLWTYASRRAGDTATLRRLQERLGGAAAAAAYHDRCGAPIHAAYAPVRLAEGHGADQWACLSGLLLAAWSGVAVRDVGASAAELSWVGLLNLHTGAVDEAIAAAAGVPVTALPAVRGDGFGVTLPWRTVGDVAAWRDASADAAAAPHAGGAATGGGASDAARAVGRLAIGDGAAAAIGSGGLDAAVLAVTVGTSAAARVLLPRAAAVAALCGGHGSGVSGVLHEGHLSPGCPVAAHPSAPRPLSPCPVCGGVRLSALGLWCYAVRDDAVLLGGALTDGGSAVSQLRDAFRLPLLPPPLPSAPSESSVESAGAPRARPPATALCLPFFGGERSTGWDGDARAAFVGLDYAACAPDALVAAAQDGVAFRLRAIADAVRRVLDAGRWEAGTAERGRAAAEVIVSGGAAAGDRSWVPLLAAVLAVPVTLREGTGDGGAAEATTTGAFMHATRGQWTGWPARGATGPASPVAGDVRVEPEPTSVAAYAAAYARHERVYAALRGLDAALACDT